MTEDEKKRLQQQETPAPKPNSVQQVETDNVNQAMGALEANKKPGFTSAYDAQINDLFDQIMNRPAFNYDVNADPIYQQLSQQYQNLGKMAMRDTMGQAAALTGGYGSTYGQAVGQQQYDAYLQELTGYIPELYGQARQQYDSEGDRLMQQLGLAQSMADDEYNRYWNEREYNYAYLMELMNATGYTPTPEEIEAAGMTQQQVDTILKAWRIQNPGLYNQMNGIVPQYRGSGGGGGGGSGPEGPDEVPPNTEEMAESSDYLPLIQNVYNRWGQSRAQQALENAIKAKNITVGEYNYIVRELNKGK